MRLTDVLVECMLATIVFQDLGSNVMMIDWNVLSEISPPFSVASLHLIWRLVMCVGKSTLSENFVAQRMFSTLIAARSDITP